MATNSIFPASGHISQRKYFLADPQLAASGLFQRQLSRFAKETLGRCAADSGHGCFMGALTGLKNSGHAVKNECLFYQLRSC